MIDQVDGATAAALREAYKQAPASRVAALARRAGCSFVAAFEAIAARGPRWSSCTDLWKDRIDRAGAIAAKTRSRVVPEPELAQRYARALADQAETFGRRVGTVRARPKRVPYPAPGERLVGGALSRAMRARAGRREPPAP